MTKEEQNLYKLAFDMIREKSNLYLLAIPCWFTPSYQVQTDKKRNQDVIIKQVAYISPEERALVEEEVIIQAGRWFKLHHRNVLRLISACHVGVDPLFAFGGCKEALSLREYHTAQERSRSEVWRLLQDAASGLAYLHDQRVVHRGLECNTIFVCSEVSINPVYALRANQNQLVRRPMAKLMTASIHGALVITEEPERAITEPEQEAKSFEDLVADDIFSLGWCIFECMAGKVADSSTDVNELVNASYRSMFSDQEWDLVISMLLRKPIRLAYVIQKLGQLSGEDKSVVVVSRPKQHQSTTPMDQVSLKAKALSLDDVENEFRQLMEVRLKGEENARTNLLLDRLKVARSCTYSVSNDSIQTRYKIADIIMALHQMLESSTTRQHTHLNPLKKSIAISKLSRQLDGVMLLIERGHPVVDQDTSRVIRIDGSQCRDLVNNLDALESTSTITRILDHTITTNSARVGSWSAEEHQRFMEAMALYPHGPWSAISAFVGTQTRRQVMLRAQKYKKYVRRAKLARSHLGPANQSFSIVTSQPISEMRLNEFDEATDSFSLSYNEESSDLPLIAEFTDFQDVLFHDIQDIDINMDTI